MSIGSLSPITHVAVRFNDRVFSLPKPNRHHHVLWKIIAETGVTSVDVRDDDQGFLDETGQYLDRRKALARARSTGQVKDEREIRMGMLFSEDVW